MKVASRAQARTKGTTVAKGLAFATKWLRIRGLGHDQPNHNTWSSLGETATAALNAGRVSSEQRHLISYIENPFWAVNTTHWVMNRCGAARGDTSAARRQASLSCVNVVSRMRPRARPRRRVVATPSTQVNFSLSHVGAHVRAARVVHRYVCRSARINSWMVCSERAAVCVRPAPSSRRTAARASASPRRRDSLDAGQFLIIARRCACAGSSCCASVRMPLGSHQFLDGLFPACISWLAHRASRMSSSRTFFTSVASRISLHCLRFSKVNLYSFDGGPFNVLKNKKWKQEAEYR